MNESLSTLLEPNLWVGQVTASWPYALVIAGYVFTFTLLGIRLLSQDLRDTLALRLMGTDRETWAVSFCQVFDALFGRKHVSFHCVVRSCVASLVAVSLIWWAMGAGETVQTRMQDTTTLINLLLIGLVINLVADYVSLLETRWLLEWMKNRRGFLAQGFALVVDFIITGAIILAVIFVYSSTPLYDGPALVMGEVFGALNIFSIFFYSTFITSVWAWGYVLSNMIIRIFSKLRLVRYFDIESNLALVLASFAAILITVLTFVLSVPLKQDELTGISPAERGLCAIFPGEVCHSLARISKDEMLRAELIFQGCIGGATRDCVDQGLAEADIDPALAAKMFYAECECGAVRGCNGLAVHYYEGSGVEKDFDFAIQLFHRACDDGLGLSCNNIANAYVDEGNGPRDWVKYEEYHMIGCDLRFARSCRSLALKYEQGNFLKQDTLTSVMFYEEACDLEDGISCISLGQLYQFSTDFQQNLSKANDFYNQACELGNVDGCIMIGTNHARAIGVKADMDAAIRFFKIACDDGDQTGCMKLGRAYRDTGEAEAALEIFVPNCEEDNYAACDLMTVMALEKSPKDMAMAKAGFRRMCELRPMPVLCIDFEVSPIARGILKRFFP